MQNRIDEDFEEGLRVNAVALRVSAGAYIHVMDTVIKPWMEGAAGNRHYVFQQDGAPAHNAIKMQALLEENLKEAWPKNIWPPNSPDCNPCDYFLWGVCEREVNKRPQTLKHPSSPRSLSSWPVWTSSWTVWHADGFTAESNVFRRPRTNLLSEAG